jgi:hypothetical protein
MPIGGSTRSHIRDISHTKSALYYRSPIYLLSVYFSVDEGSLLKQCVFTGNFFNSASISSEFKGFITAWPVWGFYRGWAEYKEFAFQVCYIFGCHYELTRLTYQEICRQRVLDGQECGGLMWLQILRAASARFWHAWPWNGQSSCCLHCTSTRLVPHSFL